VISDGIKICRAPSKLDNWNIFWTFSFILALMTF